jgi:hypothetical protein
MVMFLPSKDGGEKRLITFANSWFLFEVPGSNLYAKPIIAQLIT